MSKKTEKVKDLYNCREFIEKVTIFFKDKSHTEQECADLYFNGKISELNLAKSYLIEKGYIDYYTRKITPKGGWALENNGIIVDFENKMKQLKSKNIKFWVQTISIILTLIISTLSLIIIKK